MFEVDWRWDAEAKRAIVTVKQTQKVDDTTPLFRTPVALEIAWGTKSRIERIEVSKAEETFHFPADERPTRICFDPNNWILKELKTDKTKEEWIDQLANDEHMICRARAAEGLKQFNKDEDAGAALIAALSADRFWGVRSAVAKSLREFSGDKVRKALIAAAKSDEKSAVRREAVESLARFTHDDTDAALRQLIAEDQSYFVVAQAIRSLVKVDRDNCEADLLGQLDTVSEREVILKAATDMLVEIKSTKAAEPLAAQLKNSLTPERRVMILAALTRLKPDDADIARQLHQQLDNGRRNVRRAAIEALVEIGDPAAIAQLQERRGKEESLPLVREFDEAIEKLQAKQTGFEQLRKETESLRKQNRDLEERLKKLEEQLKAAS